MAFDDKLQQIDELQQKINSYGKLPDNILNKINYKFRLEWNYTSNSMEGNTLTKAETRSVMIGNITVDGKPIKDVLEMQSHDEVITSILKMGKGELNISEKRIKEIHKGIMHEDDAEKRKMIGQWKTRQNYIADNDNDKGEHFYFTPPADVPDKMHELINWLNTEKEKIQRNATGAMHPVHLALKFSLDYVSIHPFYDGNGRTSRILLNIILIAYGFPPVYIRKEDLGGYYRYLRDIHRDGGSPDVFFDHMAGLLIRSQQLMLDAIQGKEIDEPSDLDKKLAAFDKELEIIDAAYELKEQFTLDLFYKIYDGWLKDLLKEMINVIQKFNKYYTDESHNIHILPMNAFVSFLNQQPDEVIELLLLKIKENKSRFSDYDFKIIFSARYGPFKKGGVNTFICNFYSEIKFSKISYEIEIDKFVESGITEREKFTKKLLHQPLTKKEIEIITTSIGDSLYQYIDFKTKENGLR